MARYRQEFVVTGAGEFPFDMLRYDHCWPASEADSSELLTIAREKREVRLVRIVEAKTDQPTAERWKSFGGWLVMDGMTKTNKI